MNILRYFSLLLLLLLTCSLWASRGFADFQLASDEKAGKLESEPSERSLEQAERKQAKKMRDTQMESIVSFLAIDIDGDGLELTSLWSANAVYWDIDIDGFAEATGWVLPDDGLLALDRNGDGLINDNSELFGSVEQDGFSVLAVYDSNQDGRIDASDPIWEKLLIWQDRRLDGVSKPNELFPVKESNLISINLANTAIHELKANNKVTRRGQYSLHYAGLKGIETKAYTIENIQPSYTNTNTYYIGDTPLDFRVQFLPTLHGYGNLPNLHIAMSIDNEGPDSLLERVKAIDVPFDQLFDPDRDLEQEVTEILYRWANVQDVDPSSRGPHIDARKLGFMEQMMGEPFIQTGANDAINPLFFAAINLKEAYLMAFNNIFARLIVQSAGKELFAGNPTYILRSDKFVYVKGLNSAGIKKLKIMAGQTSDPEKRKALWEAAIRAIEYTIGIENLSEEDSISLEAAIQKSVKGGSILPLYREVKFYREQRSYWPFVLTDRIYKYFGIRLNSNLPIFGFGLLLLSISFFRAYQRRQENLGKSAKGLERDKSK